MTFKISFSDTNAQFNTNLKETNETFDAGFGDAYIMHIDKYAGDYEVTPTKDTQILQTQGKFMEHNLTVNPIPSNYGLIIFSFIPTNFSDLFSVCCIYIINIIFVEFLY